MFTDTLRERFVLSSALSRLGRFFTLPADEEVRGFCLRGYRSMTD
jgi:hypothetical protein